MWCFLGLCNVYRRFVNNVSQIASSLNAYLKKGQTTSWDNLDKDAMHAIERLKTVLISLLVLALSRQTGCLRLETDASDHQVGAVLL